MSKVVELFGESTAIAERDWSQIVNKRWCPFLRRLCLKNRKSQPDVLIGTCTVWRSSENSPIIICPHRLLERKQVFTDCIHLLTLHEPGNEFHVISEVSIPGGSVDYFLVSASKGKVRDFAGVELQTLDTTGTVWPERQRFLQEVGIPVLREDVECDDPFGMNWKMTAKTILVQLHHKVVTFEALNKHLVLAVQLPLMAYMRANFNFGGLHDALVGDSMHFHMYDLVRSNSGAWKVELGHRLSTDAAGVAQSLGLQTDAKVELTTIIAQLEEKMSEDTLLNSEAITDVTPRTSPS
jgi:hypothetical protein